MVKQPHEMMLELGIGKRFEVVDEAWREAEKLLQMLIEYLAKSGNTIIIGGHKSRGYGLARIQVKRVA
ncbi:hypothetical protein [Pyrolobus fumarii]|uniref:hypothetical protein n=1 Tax=Pyrolobus fumarii TaxID=54252 RepID=UPI00064F80DE|nr:hypothetical protein [Pyrolobus fumarii]